MIDTKWLISTSQTRASYSDQPIRMMPAVVQVRICPWMEVRLGHLLCWRYCWVNMLSSLSNQPALFLTNTQKQNTIHIYTHRLQTQEQNQNPSVDWSAICGKQKKKILMFFRNCFCYYVSLLLFNLFNCCCLKTRKTFEN